MAIFAPKQSAVSRSAALSLATSRTTRLAQVSRAELLSVGAQAEQVAELPQTLKLLGYFNADVNGRYDQRTAKAISQFQQALSLPRVGQPLAKLGQASDPKNLWKSPWVLGGIGGSSLIGATVLALSRRGRRTEDSADEPTLQERFLLPEAPPLSPSLTLTDVAKESAKATSSALPPVESIPIAQAAHQPKERVDGSGEGVTNGAIAAKAKETNVSETTRLPKINIVDELIQELRIPDPAKRQKVIWELGQRGDTRAVQPLVDLMIESDSRQRSLILSALSEIGTRTLKPLTRALAISLQDENADVRKNAIRDLTRVYDMVAQISHLLNQATDDPDKDVQETARWALGQLNRIRSTPTMEALPAVNHSVSAPESLP
ncbi:HEAT repeat domain-containing protein [Myxacorys almedinensis]|uniref:HEAT repeat domain-containing protein n=1 Tax=Myxacorys almedinensis TaxID=2651157 RepID=UPI00192ECC1F|nr:HEAT repeat domain-containing protein [Myxacorys almedinensis]